MIMRINEHLDRMCLFSHTEAPSPSIGGLADLLIFFALLSQFRLTFPRTSNIVAALALVRAYRFSLVKKET